MLRFESGELEYKTETVPSPDWEVVHIVKSKHIAQDNTYGRLPRATSMLFYTPQLRFWLREVSNGTLRSLLCVE